MIIPKSLSAIVFDWAGTVIDYGSRAPASVFVQVFKRCGVEITVQQAREPMGMAKREHIAAVFQIPDVRQKWVAQHGAEPTDHDVDRVYAEFLPLQMETLSNHCDLIPGVVEVVAECRKRGLKIAGTTGYTQELMDVVVPAAARQGYLPDVSLAADDVPVGRPAPWLLFEVAKRLDVYPMSTVVKVDDTVVGIEAGHNAGTWTVGVTRSGNQVGLSQEEIRALSDEELDERLERAQTVFEHAHAHYIIQTVADLPDVLDDIQIRLTRGEKP